MGEIKFFSARQYGAKFKATIQSTGKLGFTEDTAKELGLSTQCYIKIGADESDTDVMYLVVLSGTDDDAFKVCKAGDYFYLPTTTLFLSLGFDYRRKTIIFDLTRACGLDDALGGKVYRMNKRESERKKK